jgi:hypothetical protein
MSELCPLLTQYKTIAIAAKIVCGQFRLDNASAV